MTEWMVETKERKGEMGERIGIKGVTENWM